MIQSFISLYFIALFSFHRNEPEKALEVLESITDIDRLPAANVLNALTMEFFEKTDVENCERGK